MNEIEQALQRLEKLYISREQIEEDIELLEQMIMYLYNKKDRNNGME
jgi:hypothetical protein